MQARRRGILFVLSAPSGTGKSSLARRLLREVEGLEFSISYTTRPRRADETDGREYHFVSRETFERMVAQGEFLEWAEVYGHLYGTGRTATEAALAAGLDLLLDIDTQGARQVCRAGVESVGIFVLPPDFATLQARLRARRTEGPEALARRLARAREEAAEYSRYDYVVVNEELDAAVRKLAAIVRAERCRTSRQRGEAERILATFPRAGGEDASGEPEE